MMQATSCRPDQKVLGPVGGEVLVRLYTVGSKLRGTTPAFSGVGHLFITIK